MKSTPQPPHWTVCLLQWLHPENTLEEVQGDLEELYAHWYQQEGKFKSTLRYLLAVLSVLPPFVRRRKQKHSHSQPLFLNPTMIRNYLTIAWRNLFHQKAYSFINIMGLAVGMTVVMLIGLWIYDELSYNTYHKNYDRIAQVMRLETWNGERSTTSFCPVGMGTELSSSFEGDFTYVVMATQTEEHIISLEDKKFTQLGNYIQANAPHMLTLQMVHGTWDGLQGPNTILLSASLAKTLFGDTNPMDKVVNIDNTLNVKITGVYQDLPHNSQFNEATFLISWNSSEKFISKRDDWSNSFIYIYAQIAPHTDFGKVSAKIRDLKLKHINEQQANSKPELFLHPMSKWHLYSNFEKGQNGSGRIEFVWLFSIIGMFVLLLACINFMNLSTARSAIRAKEVGIRKTIGSRRSQLISQFLSESLLMTLCSFIIALILVQLTLPWFNEVAGKEMSLLWRNPWFWLSSISFTLITGILAGSYPALYLSAFNPVKVFKGTFQTGQPAILPRKVLVVVQFTVSITLIIGTIIVYEQIQYTKNRPVGYSWEGLLMMEMKTKDFKRKYDVLRSELKNTGVVSEIAQSASPVTDVRMMNGGFDWPGKDPAMDDNFGTLPVTPEYGKTVGWQFVAGRDFSRELASDSLGFVINEAAVRLMGLKDPVGKTIQWAPGWREAETYTIIGVVKNMVMESPFEPVRPTVFLLKGYLRWLFIKINPTVSASEALSKIEAVFKKLMPAVPFDYQFVEEQYAKKFAAEERIGKLAGFFASLTIFISCLGLFGLTSFMAEQRTKEIGVRKVLGASVTDVWLLLSKDFVRLVVVALCIAIPVAYYFMHQWLETYEYHTKISWWIFALSGAGVLLITLLIVSFQSIKVALVNPVKSLHTE